MLRAADKRLFLTQPLPGVFGGRGVRRYPASKPGRLEGPTVPPVSGYVGWWDASVVSSLTQSGGFVTAWDDRSATGDNATADAVCASYVLPSSVGRAIIVGKGTAGTCPFSIALSGSDRTQSLFLVGSIDSLAGQRVLIGASANNGRVLRLETTGKLAAVKRNTAVLATTTTLTVTQGSLFVAGLVLDTNTIDFYLNGGTPESFSNSTTFTGGLTSKIYGGEALPALTGNGSVGEVIAYDTAISSGNALLVMTYLMTKWGIV